MHQCLAIVDRSRGGLSIRRLGRLVAVIGAVTAASAVLAMTATHEPPAGSGAAVQPPADPPADRPADPPATDQAADAPTWRVSGEPNIGERVVIREVGRHERRGTVIRKDDEQIILDAAASDREIVIPRDRIVQIMILLPASADVEVDIRDFNGFTRSGKLVEDTFDEVVIDIESIIIRIPRDRIRDLAIRPSFEVRYARRLERTNLDDPEQVVRLGQWLINQRRWDVAETLLAPILAEDPDQAAVGVMLERVRARLALERLQAERDAARESDPLATGDDATTGGRSAADTAADPFSRTILSEADVNIMRVYEIDFANPPRRIAVTRDTVDRLITTYADHERMPTGRRERARLHRLEPMQLVRLIFELRARELYSEIRVIDEPASLRRFRRDVHDNFLQNNCGECHGAPGGGRFRIHTRNSRDAETRMTNLLILERLDLGSLGKLIDYDRPAESLLIQYGLPRDQARNPHPAVDGFRAAFRSRDARQIEETILWIRSMYRPRPEYPVDYDPNALLVDVERVDR